MRHLFFTLLILLLPFQTTWAAVNMYCQHEQSTLSHSIQHSCCPSAQTQSGHHSSSQTQADCACCHAINNSTLPAYPLALAFISHDAVLVSQDALFPASSPPTRPEKPNWSPAV